MMNSPPPGLTFEEFGSFDKVMASTPEMPTPLAEERPRTPCSPFIEGAAEMYKAFESHDEETVQKILSQHSIDPNRIIPFHSMTLLHLAVGLSENRTGIVERLLKRGGKPNNAEILDKLSPMHLAVMFDFDKVLKVLVSYGGDPKILSGDKKSCYDMAKDNIESEMLESCFLYFYSKSVEFRNSIKPTDRRSISIAATLNDPSGCCSSGLTDDFYSCESQQSLHSDIESSRSRERRLAVRDRVINSRRELKFEDINTYSYLMTEDESDGGIVEGRLSTINEESTRQSAVSTPCCQPHSVLSTPIATPYIKEENSELCSVNYSPPIIIGDSSSGSVSDPSCVNSTPPLLPEPSAKDLQMLQETMKNLRIPVTLSTFGVLNKFANEKDKLTKVLAPVSGTQNFSSELQLCLTNLDYIMEWGNLKIELLQYFTNNAKRSTSYYNYLLLNPKIIKKANFSGNHLKSGVINNPKKFETFLRSIFYIGKGCGKRPIQHLVDAKAKLVKSNNSRTQNLQCGEKIDKILEIWKTGLGVIVVSVFYHSSEPEANVNEAAMIDAIGLVELSNLKKGSYGGTIASSWSQKKKNQFGSFLLHKCYSAFVVGDHKSFSAKDI